MLREALFDFSARHRKKPIGELDEFLKFLWSIGHSPRVRTAMSGRFNTITIALLAVVIAMLWPLSDHCKQHRSASTRAGTGKIEQPQRLIAALKHLNDAPHRAQRPDKHSYNNKDNAVDATTASAVVQAIAAVIMVGFTHALVRFTKSSWRVGIRTARSARKSADAATESVRVAVAASQLDLRAWVAITHLSFNSVEGAPGSLRIALHTKNVGKTPALCFRGEALLLLHTDRVDIATFATSNARQRNTNPPSVIPLYPGVEVTLQAINWNLTEDEIARIKNGTGRRLYVFGEMSYMDSFGSPHSVRFAYEWMPREQRFDACSTYNDAD